MAGGRPLKFPTVEALQEKMDEYFSITKPEEYMITGLAIHLDTSRSTIMDYENRDEFYDTIKKGKDKIEMAYEKRLIKQSRSGDIFALKNFDWKDKQEIDQRSENLNMNINAEVDDQDPDIQMMVKEMEDRMRNKHSDV